MDTLLNIDKLFSKPDEEKFEHKAVFKKAALLYEFDPEKEFDNALPSDVQLLKEKAYLKINGKYILTDDMRSKILLDEIGITHIADEIKKNNIDSEFANVIVKTLASGTINYKAFPDNELFFLTKLSFLFPDKLNGDAIKNELQRRYYFAPFKKITENFAGRENQLRQINDYVDWLPKEGLVRKSIDVFRNLINWHDKPPLLIKGIGGIGKSTLISKFIVDNSIEKSQNFLPFIYIDFDLPGFIIREPLSILLESLRQLSVQFPAYKEIFNEISHYITDILSSKVESAEESVQVFRQSSRAFVYGYVDELIKKYKKGLDNLNTPVLIVFDSFEEMQYRASRTELNTFFSFIREISEKIPRIRPVFAGRSEISERLGDFKFEVIELKDFDIKSATALLNKYGVVDEKNCKTIYENFGGNPLLLMLAADLLKKDKDAIKDFNQVSGKKHEFLVKRILEQIHDSDVRKIAIPGLLVRCITPEVIQKILAVPCKLGEIDIHKAEELYNELRKEAALISKSYDAGEILFRQDLRMACESMILNKYPDESKQIRQNAIDYYYARKPRSDADEAEYYFHIMKNGEIPADLTLRVYNRIRMHLEFSTIELPEKARLYIATLLSSKVSEAVMDRSSVIEWETYYLAQIKKGLTGEMEYLHKLFNEIQQRTERSDDPTSSFPVYEALLYQRLNKIGRSNSVIDHALQFHGAEDNFDPIGTELRFIKAQNLEYTDRYEEALSVCPEDEYEVMLNLEDSNQGNKNSANEKIVFRFSDYDFLVKKCQFMRMRLSHRCGLDELEQESDFKDVTSGEEDASLEVHWNYIFRRFNNRGFNSYRNFLDFVEKYKHAILTVDELERYCRRSLNVFLKDISLSGEFEIVLRDLMYVMESTKDLEDIPRTDPYR